jgi:DNA end-binding protein Ku
VARTIWKGAISFSLIHIPVALHPASRPASLDFTLLDRRDFAPVGYQRINKDTGKTVQWDDIVKGYEYEKGEYVVMSDEDFRQANVEATQTIDIQGFVDPVSIPPLYYDTPYYLAPEKHGEKVYTLLREALTKTGTVAIGLIVLRTKQHVCVLMPLGPALLLNTLRYADEVLPHAELAPTAATLEQAKVSPREFSMALKLVEDMREKTWDPSAYHDTYREDLLKRIDAKVKAGQTKEITPSPERTPERRTAQVVDLTELLKRSLEQRGRKPAGGDAGNSRRAPAHSRAHAPSGTASASRTRRRRRA